MDAREELRILAEVSPDAFVLRQVVGDKLTDS